MNARPTLSDPEFKKVAKRLQKQIPSLSLSSCQEHLSKALGFKDFHDFQAALALENSRLTGESTLAQKNGLERPIDLKGNALLVGDRGQTFSFLKQLCTTNSDKFCLVTPYHHYFSEHRQLKSLYQSKPVKYYYGNFFLYEGISSQRGRLSFWESLPTWQSLGFLLNSLSMGLYPVQDCIDLAQEAHTKFRREEGESLQNLVRDWRTEELGSPRRLIKEGFLYFLEEFEGLFVETLTRQERGSIARVGFLDALLADHNSVFLLKKKSDYGMFLSFVSVATDDTRILKKQEKRTTLMFDDFDGNVPTGFIVSHTRLSQQFNVVYTQSYVDFEFRAYGNRRETVAERSAILANTQHVYLFRAEESPASKAFFHITPLFKECLKLSRTDYIEMPMVEFRKRLLG